MVTPKPDSTHRVDWKFQMIDNSITTVRAWIYVDPLAYHQKLVDFFPFKLEKI